MKKNLIVQMILKKTLIGFQMMMTIYIFVLQVLVKLNKMNKYILFMEEEIIDFY